jgi:glyoxylase-like metal-dependent hydrolase (beta-lactamase superfamily II)
MMTRIAMNISRAAVAAIVLVAIAATVHAQQDFSKVEIKTTKIGGNVYTLEGQGGTIGALVGPDGVFMVDAQFAPLSDKIAAALKQISDGRIRFVVNTHVHGDHTGGNPNFAKMGATLLSREELRARLAKPAKGDPPPAAALPMLTYSGPVTIRMNGEEVQLIPVPIAHTDGDTMVRFVTADVIMTGDFYRSVGYPNIDRNSGGSLNGMLAGLQAIVDLAGPNTKIIPGHGPIVDETAVTAHRNMMIALRDRVAPLVKQGKTQDEVVAAKLNADYDGKVPQPGTTGERFITQLYAELKGGAGSQ